MNIHSLRDSDDDAGFYAAACAADAAATWPGCSLFHSSDSGASYTLLATITAESVMGYTSNALGDFAGGNVPDELNSVNVVMVNGTLSSTTFAGLLSGTNMAILGDEIMYFRDATLETNGSYTLRGFLRGRRGSNYAMSTHAAAERFILVSTSTMVRVPQVNADIGQTRLYKPVTGGKTLAATTAQSFTNSGKGLWPHAPAQLGGGRDASNNATLQWVRCDRKDFEWRDSVDVPMSENTESYAIDIFSDGTHAVVIDTLTSTSESVAYSAASQTSAGITPGDQIYFGVVQISSVVGRGHMAYGSI